jgi:hypothetical protein
MVAPRVGAWTDNDAGEAEEAVMKKHWWVFLLVVAVVSILLFKVLKVLLILK